ncbi:uncharacterized protein TNCV_1354951 [Trichonephila clavipes]|uniref:Uncharacterized protein n=1 Tax=Trichonephila clavipes TaxID=2585209 RepID=A0A8X6VI20_TRICX|nr:uncharacterized protein TNCV_1354951 [Trichonephila clavipes]
MLENQSQICPNPSRQYISINCRQMKIHNMLCALWEKKVGAGTIKALYQVKNTPTNIPSQMQFFLKLKFFFRDLTAKELLLKCLHGRTQNPNESFNNCVWNRVPKKTFVSKRTLQMGVMDAVICFNEGAYARTEVLKALKINPGVNTCEGLRKIDYVRISEAEMAVQKASKKPGQQKGKLKGNRML